MKIKHVDPDVVSLVCFTANEIAKEKGWAITLKESEVKLVLESVALINTMERWG